MTSKEVKQFYDDGKMDQLYKKCEPYFNLIDLWADKMIGGDILNEMELSQVMEQLNGCQTKLNPIAGCLEAMVEEYESNYQIEEEKAFPSMRVQDQNSCKAKARGRTGDLKRFASDFTRYSYSAQNTVTVAQSRLKRLVIEGGNKGIHRTGETEVNKEPNENLKAPKYEKASEGGMEWIP